MAAFNDSRRREVPVGTVGGRTALTQYPASQMRSAAITALAASPIITGTMLLLP